MVIHRSGLGTGAELILGAPQRSHDMSLSIHGSRDALERRVADLEIRLIRVASQAEFAWNAERERSKATAGPRLSIGTTLRDECMGAAT